MPTMSRRLLGGVCGALILGAGCGDQYAMVTAALMTDPDDLTTGEMTGGTGGTTMAQPTESTPTDGGDPSGDPGGDTDNDPTEPTTGPSATCDTPEQCTGMGSGDLGPVAMPFFRGKVCVSEAVKPGDTVAMSMSACVHPCLADTQAFAYTTALRVTDAGVEKALAFYFQGVSGTNCPPDVFGEFPAEACVFTGPTNVSPGSIVQNGDPYAGDWTLTVPFLTNEDAAAFAGGADSDDEVWTRVDSHMQAGERVFAMSFDAGNQTAPAECGDGVAGCTCRNIGL